MKISPKQYARLIEEHTEKAAELWVLDEKIVQIADLIRRNRDQPNMDKIIVEYDKLIQKKSGLLVVRVESAKKLDIGLEDKIKERVSQKKGVALDKVKLISRVERKLIGGIRVKIGNEVVDASVASKLARLKMSLA